MKDIVIGIYVILLIIMACVVSATIKYFFS